MADLHRYRLFGLVLASELPLPELAEDEGAREPDVVVSLASIPRDPAERPGLAVRGRTAWLDIAEVGRFRMDSGRALQVEPHAGASPRNVRLYLLGSAFAALLHQRALLPLHANAVAVGGKVIAFMGHPGAGKSTLAAWFHDRGFPVLADDVCVVTRSADGRPLAQPGIPRLRLWRDALEASGRSADGYERAFDDLDKYSVPALAAQPREALPLSHVYLLEKAESEAGSIERVPGSEGVAALVANTYRGAYVPMMGRTGEHLLACARLAGDVAVFRAPRRWGHEAFEAEARALLAHAEAHIARHSISAASGPD